MATTLREYLDKAGVLTLWARMKATFAKKSDLQAFYTKSETDDLLEGKANAADIPTVPTNVSAFNNDAEYVTSGEYYPN